jgi:hypothetical protein
VEVEQRFGRGTGERVRAMATIRHLHQLAVRTGALRSFCVFGSFVSTEPTPRDVDVILVMRHDFRVEHCPREALTVFTHADAQARFGASVFWLREAKLERLLEDLRGTARPEEWPALSSGYRLEIERLQGEILDYLVRAAPEAKRTTAA